MDKIRFKFILDNLIKKVAYLQLEIERLRMNSDTDLLDSTKILIMLSQTNRILNEIKNLLK